VTGNRKVYAPAAALSVESNSLQGRMEQKHLLLLAGSAAEGVGDSLASIAETLLGRLEHAAALLLGRVAA
jgi:hypothetical protein